MKIDFLIVRPGFPAYHYDPDADDRAEAVAQGLKDLGYVPALLTMTGHGDCRVPGIPVFKLSFREETAEGRVWGPETANRYGIHNFRHLAFCDFGYQTRELHPIPLQQLAREVPGAFEQLHALFEEHDIRRVFHPDMGGEILRQAVSRIADVRGIPSAYALATDYFPGRTLIVREKSMTPLIEKPRVRFSDLPPERQRFIRDDLAAKRDRKPVIGVVQRRSFSNLAKSFVAERKFLQASRVRKAISTTGDFVTHRKIRKTWKAFDSSKSYVYLPLAHAWESVMILHSPDYFRQDYVAEFISRTLPQDMELYVKQHIHNPVEAMPPETTVNLASMQGLRIIPPTTNAWDVMRSAKAVAVIHGTTGFEALLLKKPVILFGFAPYRGWGLTHDVNRLRDFPTLLDQALADTITEERLLDFLASFESIHLEGTMNSARLDAARLGSIVSSFFNRQD